MKTKIVKNKIVYPHLGISDEIEEEIFEEVEEKNEKGGITMQYTCLKKCAKAFIITRNPEVVEDELIISFSGAPPGATAIFENSNGNSIYRLLSDDACSIPADFLVGEIKVTVTILNGKVDAEKITCEPICAERKNGVILVYPNWLDLPMQIIEIYGEIQGVKDGMSELLGKYDSLDKKVEKLLDGYDFD